MKDKINLRTDQIGHRTNLQMYVHCTDIHGVSSQNLLIKMLSRQYREKAT